MLSEKIFDSSPRPKYKLKPSNKLKPLLYISKIRYRSIIDKINKGNIEVTNILQNFVLGRKTKRNQKAILQCLTINRLSQLRNIYKFARALENILYYIIP